jgi:hypothetical protein
MVIVLLLATRVIVVVVVIRHVLDVGADVEAWLDGLLDEATEEIFCVQCLLLGDFKLITEDRGIVRVYLVSTM